MNVSIHDDQINAGQVSFDYDLVSLSNTLAYSFEEGLQLASSMLNAPFFILNHNNYVLIRSETNRIDDPVWNSISETSFCDPKAVAANGNIYCVTIHQNEKLVYYPAREPNGRQLKFAEYIAWIISLFGEEYFFISDYTRTPKSAFLFHQVNERSERVGDLHADHMANKLPPIMQVFACYRNTPSEICTAIISKLCCDTEYETVYKHGYRIFLLPQLSCEQTELLSEQLSKYSIYAGLSYSFHNYKEINDHTLQAIAALNETVKRNTNNHLAQYEDLFAQDVLCNYSYDTSFSYLRHPLFQELEQYDKKNNSELYITLVAYIENSGNTNQTAEQMPMHRNTVLYRLRHVTKVTGYDVQSPDCRASLLYAMMIERVVKKAVR